MSNGEGAEGSKVDSATKDSSSDKASGSGKIFIGGLSWETTTEKLTNHFKKYGEIIDSVIMKDRVTGHARGFGFVTYSDPSVCDRVIQDKHVLDGRTVEIKRSIPRDSMVKGPKTKKIFVGGISPSITEEEFKNYFAQFGKIVEHQIMQDHGTGRSRGFGFVTFDSEQVVDELLSKGTMIELGGKQVEIKKAEPKKATVESGPPPGKGGNAGEYGVYGDFGAYDGGAYGPYRSGGGRFAGRADGGYGRGYAMGGYGDYGRSGYGSSGFGGGSHGAYGGSSLGGGYGSSLSYDGLGGGYGGYGDMDGYGSLSSYGGYGSNNYGAGYGSSGNYSGGYGSGRYGTGGSGRYHPYGRN